MPRGRPRKNKNAAVTPENSTQTPRKPRAFSSRHTTPATAAAKEHHETEAASIHAALQLLDQYLDALNDLERRHVDRQQPPSDLNLPASLKTTARDWSSEHVLEVISDIIDENPQPSLEFVLGVLGLAEVPKNLEERQRSLGSKAFAGAMRNCAVKAKREKREKREREAAEREARALAERKAREKAEAEAREIALRKQREEKERKEREQREGEERERKARQKAQEEAQTAMRTNNKSSSASAEKLSLPNRSDPHADASPSSLTAVDHDASANGKPSITETRGLPANMAIAIDSHERTKADVVMANGHANVAKSDDNSENEHEMRSDAHVNGNGHSASPKKIANGSAASHSLRSAKKVHGNRINAEAKKSASTPNGKAHHDSDADSPNEENATSKLRQSRAVEPPASRSTGRYVSRKNIALQLVNGRPPGKDTEDDHVSPATQESAKSAVKQVTRSSSRNGKSTKESELSSKQRLSKAKEILDALFGPEDTMDRDDIFSSPIPRGRRRGTKLRRSRIAPSDDEEEDEEISPVSKKKSHANDDDEDGDDGDSSDDVQTRHVERRPSKRSERGKVGRPARRPGRSVSRGGRSSSRRRAAIADTSVQPVRSKRLRRESTNLIDGAWHIQDRDPYIMRCIEVWETVNKNRITIPFREPVQEKDAPGYFSVVKHPMDMKKVKQLIESGEVRTPQEFYSNMLQICSNAVLFNDSESDIYGLAVELRALIRKECRGILHDWRTENDLDGSSESESEEEVESRRGADRRKKKKAEELKRAKKKGRPKKPDKKPTGKKRAREEEIERRSKKRRMSRSTK